MSILDLVESQKCPDCNGRGQWAVGGGENYATGICRPCYGSGFDGGNWYMEPADPTTGIYSATAFHTGIVDPEKCQTLHDNIDIPIGMVYRPRDGYRDVGVVSYFECACGERLYIVGWDVIIDHSVSWNRNDEPIPPFRNHADDVFDDVTDVGRLRRDFGVGL